MDAVSASAQPSSQEQRLRISISGRKMSLVLLRQRCQANARFRSVESKADSGRLVEGLGVVIGGRRVPSSGRESRTHDMKFNA